MIEEHKIPNDWLLSLGEEFEKKYFLKLKETLYNEEQRFTLFPPSTEVFAAYHKTPLNKIKVVIIGQDPYHGEGQANGLCFSVREGVKHPPSLQNIFKEIAGNFNVSYPVSGNLNHWAEQGVFLLNTALTVRSGEANSHKDIGWQKFTDQTIKAISDNREGIVFLLWGGYAKKKSKLIDKKKHIVLESGHPSPLSANRGYWFGNEHFLKVNEILKKRGELGISWL